MSNTVEKVVFTNVEPTAVAAAPITEPAAQVDDGKVFKFAKPYTLGDKTFTELNLDVDLLSGRDIKAAEKEYRMRYRDSLNIPFLDTRFREILVGKLNNIIGEDLENLPAGTYNAVMLRVQAFLGSQV